MATRALPDLVARIRVDSTGVDSAMTSLVSSFGKANLALAGVAAGIGILIVGGKSMIDIAEKHDKAVRNLEQAYKSSGTNLDAYRKNIDDFIIANHRYISDQSEVIDSYAKLTRAGLTQTEVQKDVNRALDIAAIKHISVSDATDLLVKAEQGRLRGLIDLGVSTGKYTDAQGNLINGTKDVSRVMDELDKKTKNGRDTLTSLQQNSNILSNDWQNLSEKGGPVLLILLDKVVGAITAVYDAFDRVGKDDALWGRISDRLVKIAKWIHDWILGPLGQAGQYISGAPIIYGDGNVQATGAFGKGGRQHGGPVIPGGIYTVGEAGPETLVMGSRGGMVIPNAGSTTHYNLTLNGSGAVNDPDGVRRMLQRMQLLGTAG